MLDLQDITIQTYKDNFDTYIAKTPTVPSGEFVVLLDTFIHFLPKHASVFEIGSAEGRDARYFREKEIKMYCTDVIPQALARLEQDAFETSLYDFRDTPKEEWLNHFDGVFAKAVFLHATKEIFENALFTVSTLLKQNGIFCVTFKRGENEEIETDKLGGKRYFKYYTKTELEAIFNACPFFKILDISETSDKKWIQLIARKEVK